MTDSIVRPPCFDPRPLLHTELPAHVLALVGDRVRPAWLIGRLHCADGWVALIQYADDTGHECTLRLPADRITL